jgi:hypothetical protein
MGVAMTEKTKRVVWKRWLIDAILIVLVSAAVIALFIWLSSMKRWWADALTTYVSAFIMSGAMIGAYAGWAFDEMDDPGEERRMLWTIGLIAVLLPLLIVLGLQVLGTAFDDAPGNWPRWADAVARAVISTSSVVLGAALLVRLARAGKGTAVWITGALFFFALMLVGAWPWLGSYFPVWMRVASLVGLLSVAVLIAKAIRRGNAPSP